MKSNLRSTSIDLYSMSQGIVDTSGNKKQKKKTKTHFGKNLFTLGFDVGFTKALIKTNYTNILAKKKMKQTKTTLIFNKSTTHKKKNKK